MNNNYNYNNSVIDEATDSPMKGSDTLRGIEHKKFSHDPYYIGLVRAAAYYYENMHDLHKAWKRANDFVMGRQLEDYVTYNGQTMSTQHYIEMKGLPAIQNDVISDKMITLVGLARQQNTTTIYKSVEERGAQVVNLFNEMLRQNCILNHRTQMDAELTRKLLVYGFLALKTVWGYDHGRQDIWNKTPDIFKLALPPFMESDLSDVEFIAEAHDESWGTLLENFTESPEDIKKLEAIYAPDQSFAREQGYNDTGMNQTRLHSDFYHSTVLGRYRVIEIWTKERKTQLWCHDKATGDAGFRPLSDEAWVKAENARRKEDNIRKDEYGMPILTPEGKKQYYEDPKTLALIEYKRKTYHVWYYRFITPNGYLLQEGESPYRVLRNGRSHTFHPYTFLAYPCLQGEIRSFVMNLEDKQMAVNHNMLMMEFIITNEAKGVLAIDQEALTPEMGIEDIAENYMKVDGTILYTSKKGGNIPQTIQGKSIPAGMQWMAEFNKQMVTDQSGVQPSLQGAHVGNTSGRQYNMERQQAATSVNDHLETLNQFKLREAEKKLWTMQCFYDSSRSIQITGDDFRTYYDESYSDIDLIAATDLDEHSAQIRDKIDDMLWQLMSAGKIGLMTMFKGGSFTGTERAQRLIEQEMEEQAQAQQMAAQQGASPAMATSSQGADPLQQQEQGADTEQLKDEEGPVT